MIPALILLAALCALGLVLWLLHRRDVRRGASTELHGPKVVDPPAGNNLEEGACCGMHITCERDSLLAGISEKIEYFDDEELDAYAGRSPESYTPEEADEFRDVLLTLLPADIAPWARSLQLRGIELPADVREELLMIVAEARADAAGARH
ncbi:phospholipase [Muribaculaceae bacterium Isolate-013 (NCI)]|nr:phospholipase [Muribaculaceae bacterium Isolate-013 (NCI)]